MHAWACRVHMAVANVCRTESARAHGSNAWPRMPRLRIAHAEQPCTLGMHEVACFQWDVPCMRGPEDCFGRTSGGVWAPAP
jgi:hypothetical protein